MAIRTEQHGNAFAKLNNSNLGDCVAPPKKPARLASSLADLQASKIAQPLKLLERRLRG
jgi:hypothetical protein